MIAVNTFCIFSMDKFGAKDSNSCNVLVVICFDILHPNCLKQKILVKCGDENASSDINAVFVVSKVSDAYFIEITNYNLTTKLRVCAQ